MATHELKVWPQYFEALMDGSKTFEVRKNDRDFQIGDTLVLREWNPEPPNIEIFIGRVYGKYTGRECKRTVTYILRGGQFGIEDGYCVMGTRECNENGHIDTFMVLYAADVESELIAPAHSMTIDEFVQKANEMLDQWGDEAKEMYDGPFTTDSVETYYARSIHDESVEGGWYFKFSKDEVPGAIPVHRINLS